MHFLKVKVAFVGGRDLVASRRLFRFYVEAISDPIKVFVRGQLWFSVTDLLGQTPSCFSLSSYSSPVFTSQDFLGSFQVLLRGWPFAWSMDLTLCFFFNLLHVFELS